MTDHLKLTDEALGEIGAAVYDMHTIDGRGRELLAAIRALRDAAAKVCSYDYDGDWRDQYDASRAITALAALLPDEPKGGG